jgi:hypothetical protein
MPDYNLITGKLANLMTVPLQPTEQAAFNAWFDRLVTQKNEVDIEIGQSYQKERAFYAFAATVAKAYFSVNNEPFVPQEPTSGTFGAREILPQDIGIIDWVTNIGRSTVHSWVQTISVAANVIWDDVFGTVAVPVTPSNTQNFKGLLAFHSLISWQPGTRITAQKFGVNAYTYPEVSVEQAAKITKPFKPFKLLPLEGDFLIHPSGTFNMRAAFEKVNFAAGTQPETYTEEIAIMGILFAEYQYLATEVS